MSVRIDCNGKEILLCKNIAFSVLHSNILTIIRKEKINVSHNLLNLLERTDQDIYGSGIGIDIEKYINEKEDVLLFANLIKQAIVNEKSQYHTLPEEADLWHFYDELIKYAEELK